MKKSCTHCSQAFEITTDDLAFYEKVSPVIAGKRYDIPPPTLCPDCRIQRRIAWRNERHLYHRKCDLTGKQIISVYAPDSSCTVYDQKKWWSDAWDPFEYGRDIDWDKSFLEQYRELQSAVPIPHIHMESCENADYANFCWQIRNCYLTFASDRSEDCYYSDRLVDCSNCVDSSFSNRCTACYQVLDCNRCYHCLYSKDCSNCERVHFSIDCKNCKSCFGCTGLRQKEFHLFNEPLSKAEYEARLSELVLSEEMIDVARKQAMELWQNYPRLFANLLQCEDCTGDNLVECKNCKDSFDGMGAVDCARIQNCPGDTHDCQDIYAVGYGSENCYDCYCLAAKNTLFSYLIYPSGDNIIYSAHCSVCSNVFGCIGLRHKQYCIFNKQYSKEEYEKLVPKIIEKMKANGEWGEFFPVHMSPFAYNETLAHEYFPMTKEEVLPKGWKWRDEEQARQQYMGPDYELPRDIKDVSDDVAKQILRCKVTGKPYKIIPQELKFYREMGIPIPKKCPDQRHKERMALRNPRKLWARRCAKCDKDIQTTYAPTRPETVYCEECYLQTVY